MSESVSYSESGNVVKLTLIIILKVIVEAVGIFYGWKENESEDI